MGTTNNLTTGQPVAEHRDPVADAAAKTAHDYNILDTRLHHAAAMLNAEGPDTTEVKIHALTTGGISHDVDARVEKPHTAHSYFIPFSEVGPDGIPTGKPAAQERALETAEKLCQANQDLQTVDITYTGLVRKQEKDCAVTMPLYEGRVLHSCVDSTPTMSISGDQQAEKVASAIYGSAAVIKDVLVNAQKNDGTRFCRHLI